MTDDGVIHDILSKFLQDTNFVVDKCEAKFPQIRDRAKVVK